MSFVRCSSLPSHPPLQAHLLIKFLFFPSPSLPTPLPPSISPSPPLQDGLNYFFSTLFVLDLFLKFVGLGPKKFFLKHTTFHIIIARILEVTVSGLCCCCCCCCCGCYICMLLYILILSISTVVVIIMYTHCFHCCYGYYCHCCSLYSWPVLVLLLSLFSSLSLFFETSNFLSLSMLYGP